MINQSQLCHTFNVDCAEIVGVNCAIVCQMIILYGNQQIHGQQIVYSIEKEILFHKVSYLDPKEILCALEKIIASKLGSLYQESTIEDETLIFHFAEDVLPPETSSNHNLSQQSPYQSDEKSLLDPNWMPGKAVIEQLENVIGIDFQLLEEEIGFFKIYYLNKKVRAVNWDIRFANWVRNSWNKQQQKQSVKNLREIQEENDW